MRDYCILTEPLLIEDKENTKITTLVTAIEEYYKYYNCKDNYYKEKEDGSREYLTEGDPNELDKKYELEKAFHWNCFWSLVALNVENWLGKTNAAI